MGPLKNFLFQGLLGLFVLLSTAVQTGAKPLKLSDAERAYLDEKRVLKVCIDPDWMPNEQIGDNGEYQGISSDYMALFSSLLDTAIVLHPTSSWRDTIEAARNRACDLVSLINRSEEREAFLHFSQPYLSYAYVFIAREGAPFIDDIAQYTGKVFSVVKGYRVGQKVREAYPNLTLIDVASTKEGQQKVLSGEVFAHIDTSVVQTYVQRVNGFTGLAASGTLPWQSSMSLATRNDEPLLAEIFQKAVAGIPPSEHARIRNKWIAVTVEKVFNTTLLFQILGVVAAFILVIALWGVTLWRSRQALRLAHAQLGEQAAELKKIATIDGLTQVFNRRAIMQKLDEEILRSNRFQYQFGVILLDIDHFKQVNDGYGHQTGDALLQSIAKLLVENSRTTDTVGRWGGEEFIVICPETDLGGVKELAEKLRHKIAESDFENCGKCTASFGTTLFENSDTQNTLLERADRALYKAKENGRNLVRFG